MERFSLTLSPFQFLVTTDSPIVKSNLKTIYDDKFKPYSKEMKHDYHVQMLRSNGLRGIIRKQCRFLHDQNEPFKPLEDAKAFAFLEWGMNYVIAANEARYVIVHSAVLAKDNKAILFPAPPGSGKSTLTSHLCFNGWRLLSDEMALIIPQSKTVQPFVRPICLKNNSIDLAKSWFSDGKFSTIAKDTHKGDVIHLSPPKDSWANSDTPAEVIAVVFPNYRPNVALDIYQLNQVQGFMQLADNAFNYGIQGKEGFDTLTNLVEHSQCFEIFYNDLNQVQQFLEKDILAYA
ncbi:HprK-related kinase A [Catenovulum sp. SX2]|uniref:HprK-related kinase A n=1 Tax=Catenovulum sp. SX2 TaxID=3398614 RepID=UPI003F859FC6